MLKTEQLHSPQALTAYGNNWRSRELIGGMTVVALPIYSDNYIWLLHDDTSAWVFDPGNAEPIIDYLEAHKLTLKGVMITHSHWDHVTGIEALASRYPAPVYGPAGIHSGIDHEVAQDSIISAGKLTFKVQATPGHMTEHLSYYEAEQQLLFCGDTLFSAGCGRLKQTGNMEALFSSLAWMQTLPPNTLIFCSHEYTLANLAFAQAAEPSNPLIGRYLETIAHLRASHRPSLPSTLATELAINPFLRLPEDSPLLNEPKLTAFERFQALRHAKDQF